MTGNDRITLETLDLEVEMRDGFTARCARRKARELVGLDGLTQADVNDLAQEFANAVLARLEKFDPDVAHWNVFVTTIVERQVARFLKARRATKRRIERDRWSLSIPVATEEDGWVELGATVLESEGCNLSSTEPVDPLADVDWEHDLEVVLAGLPDDLRDICLRLRTAPVTRVAADLGLTRSALRYRLRTIRAHFERHGFGNPAREL